MIWWFSIYRFFNFSWLIEFFVQYHFFGFVCFYFSFSSFDITVHWYIGLPTSSLICLKILLLFVFDIFFLLLANQLFNGLSVLCISHFLVFDALLFWFSNVSDVQTFFYQLFAVLAGWVICVSDFMIKTFLPISWKHYLPITLSVCWLIVWLAAL